MHSSIQVIMPQFIHYHLFHSPNPQFTVDSAWGGGAPAFRSVCRFDRIDGGRAAGTQCTAGHDENWWFWPTVVLMEILRGE